MCRVRTGRAMQFSVFSWYHWAFVSFPPVRGKAGMGGRGGVRGPSQLFTPTPTLSHLRGREQTDRQAH